VHVTVPVDAAYVPFAQIVHAEAPVASANLPTAQLTQSVDAVPAVPRNFPTAQSVQICAPSTLNLPAAQDTHRSEICDAATSPSSDKNFPATQDVHDDVVSPVALLYLPAAQIVQSESSSWLDSVVAASALNLPAGHAVHDVAVEIVAVKDPAGHIVQTAAAASLNFPITQAVHKVAPAALEDPAAHEKQSAFASCAAADTAASELYFPAVQSVQTLSVFAVATLNFPTPQIVQSESAS
jgi:hypothetical protein